MDTKYVKFDWNRHATNNSGHTQNEWGVRKRPNKTIIVEAYTLSEDYR